MSQQDHDFFATGRPANQSPAPLPPTTSDRAAPAQANQFGQAIDPQGRPVNQFGTPVDGAAAPTGPSAASGYGASPVAARSLGPAWQQPQGPSKWDSPGGPPVGPPGMYAGPRGHGYRSSNDRPTPVLVAGIISIVCGAIVLTMGLVLAILVMGAKPTPARSAGQGAVLAVGLMLALVLGLGVLYLVLGIALVKSHRWAAWTTLVLTGLGLLYSLAQLVIAAGSGKTYNAATQVSTTNHSSSLLSVLLASLFLALLLVPPSWKWLTRRP